MSDSSAARRELYAAARRSAWRTTVTPEEARAIRRAVGAGMTPEEIDKTVDSARENGQRGRY